MGYFDYNATHPIRHEVIKEMPGWLQNFANPSSRHQLGNKARDTLESSRESLATDLGCHHKEIIFTSGGTEGNHLALLGYALANLKPGARIISSPLEHSSVLSALKILSLRGFTIEYLPLDKTGAPCLDTLARQIWGAGLVSLMWANNETGQITDMDKVKAICQGAGVCLHSDCVQALGKTFVNLQGLDFATFSSHKIGGLKGSGAVFLRSGRQIQPLWGGGEQERKLRTGTQNPLAAQAMALALNGMKNKGYECGTGFRNLFEERLLSDLKGRFSINGLHGPRIGNTSSVTFHGLDGQALMFNLDLAGHQVSMGSACASGSVEPSHVLLAMGMSPKDAKSTLRFSFGCYNDESQVNHLVSDLHRLVLQMGGKSE